MHIGAVVVLALLMVLGAGLLADERSPDGAVLIRPAAKPKNNF